MGMHLLLIDNYDSFTYLLVQYFRELGAEVTVTTDSDDLAQAVLNSPSHICQNYDALIISPGPKSPQEALFSCEVVRSYADKLPILGVCLGQQVIAEVFGGKIIRAIKPRHGFASKMRHNNQGLFKNLEQNFVIARYHSLVVEQIPQDFVVDGWSEDGVIQAIHHVSLPLWGVQFHPESFITDYGHEILRNFLVQVEAFETVYKKRR